ncbi:MAG: phosphate ABC transporter ATP-binding protein PstB [Acidobacteria bacterium]|nr:phosphate ABC transporter ATP-binding protein PstB [Acidobacteriota bacterium]MDW7984989.1 phosphate ABC transporter ATP-binding protein PstB [Acidobacteriota bacterium]
MNLATQGTPVGEPYVVEPSEPVAVEVQALSVWYRSFQALADVSFSIPRHRITAVIGPSGCGKSTFIRCLNRMNDLIPEFRMTGDIRLEGARIYEMDPTEVRRRVGMVFQKPNPFPKSIWENIAWGLRINGRRHDLAESVERALRRAALWDEVKDKLHMPATSLSGGQQQRLCIARVLAVEPEVLLLDEPTSSLDPIATARIEDLLIELKDRYTIVIVTHNIQQAARISDYAAFFYLGRLIEFQKTEDLFTRPRCSMTEAYITGRFG